MTAAPLLRSVSGILLALVGMAGLWSLQRALGAKPATTHTSTIFYSQLATPIHYQMYEDGTSKTPIALPAGVFASPSSKAYGGHRWWVTTDIDPDTGFAELFAYRGNGNPPVQLTLAGADVSFAQGESQVPRWSNDGLDRFVTFNAGTLAGGFLCRLWIGDEDIAAIALGAPPFTAANIEFVLPDPGGYAGYAWSNQDGMLAYLKLNYDNAGNSISRTIWVRVLTEPPTDLPIYTRTNAVGTISTTGNRSNFIQWSGDGSRIAFSTYNSSSYGGVWTIKPDGTQPVKVQTNSGTMTYTSRGWSPDSKQLLLHVIKARPGDWYYNLARMPAGGGTLTTLTGDLLETRDKTVVGWAPLSP